MVAAYRYALVWLGVLLALAVAAPRAEAQYAQEIAVTGVVVPGTGGNAFSTFGVPVINNISQVAFHGFLNGGAAAGGGDGIFSVPATFPSPPTLNSILLNGYTLSGSQPNGPTFTSFMDQVNLGNVTSNSVWPLGQMAMFGFTNNNANQGVFGVQIPGGMPGIPASGNPNPVAYSGTPAPGTSSIYNSFSAYALNDNNQVAFDAVLSTPQGEGIFIGPVPNTNQTIITNPSGTANPVVLAGQFAPTIPAGQLSYTGFVSTSLRLTSNNQANNLAFQAGLVSNVDGSNSTGILVAPAGTSATDLFNKLTLVAQTGTVAPTSPTYTGSTSFLYSSFDPKVFALANNSANPSPGNVIGQVAFKANLVSSTDPTITGVGIFAGNSALPSGGKPVFMIASTLQPAQNLALPINYSPLYPQGGNFLGFGNLGQNGNGVVAFQASLQPIGQSGGGGIFLAKPNGNSFTVPVPSIAVAGDPAPGTGGATYSSFFNTPIAINDHNGPGGSPEVAFQAFLAGPGVNGGNNIGIFLANDQKINVGIDPTNPNHTETVLLARTGDLLTVNPGVQRVISGFSSGGNAGFNSTTGIGANSINDLGQVTVAVTFTDGAPGAGTQGIYVFSPDLHPTAAVTGTLTSNWAQNWTFNFDPTNQVYRVFMDPQNTPTTPTVWTVNGPTTNQAIPALQVGGGTGVAHLKLQGAVTLTLGGGAITGGINVLTIQAPSDITTVGNPGTTSNLKLFGDVTSLVGPSTALIAANFDLGNAPAVTPLTAPFITPPPSTADVDRFRTFNVARGNFVGANPIDLLISGIIANNSEVDMVQIANGQTIPVTNNVFRGLLKTGPGTLQLTGINTFGPNATGAQVSSVTVNDPYAASAFIESVVVTGGTLSVSQDANLGALPPPNIAKPRWIVLDGGALQSTGTFVLNSQRGISLGPVTGFGAGAIDVTAGNTMTYGGIFSDNTDGVTHGIGTLTKTGAGTLILGGTNTYSGGTVINGGTLQINFLGNIANGSVVDNGVLAFNLGSIPLTVSQVIPGSGAVALISPNTTLVLTGANTYAGGTIFTAGTISVSSDANLGSESGPLFFNGGTLQITSPSFGSTPRAIFWGSGGGNFLLNTGGTFTISQSLTDPGSVAPLGVGSNLQKSVLVLSGINTFTGGVSIGGNVTLSVSSDANLGAISGSLSFGTGGVLQVTGTTFTSTPRAIIWGNGGGGFDIANAANTFTVAQNLLEPAPGTLSADLTKLGAGTLVLTGTNTYRGNTNITAGELSVSADTNLGAAITNIVFQTGGILRITGTTFTSTPRGISWGAGGFDIAAAANIFTVAQPLGGAGAPLTKLGAGTLVLTGANSYSGGTFFNGGELQAAGNGNLGAAGQPLTFNGGLLKFGAVFDPTTTRVTTFLAPGGGGFDTNNLAITLGGVLGGAGGLIKSGNGTLTLNAPLPAGNTYAGGTTVNNGTLQVAVDSLLGAAGSPVTLNASGVAVGTLLFTGPGAAPDLTTTRPFTLNGGVLAAAAGVTVTLNNTSVVGGNVFGYIAGPGTFATQNLATVPNASTSFFNGTTLATANVVLNGADTVFNFNQGGHLTVATGATTPVTFVNLTRVTNLGSGTITIGAAGSAPSVNVSDFQTAGAVNISPASVAGQFALIKNVGFSPLSINGGGRITVGTVATAPAFAAGIDMGGQNIVINGGGLLNNNGFVADSSGTGSVIVNFGGTYKGTGVLFQPLVINTGGKLQPGDCPGLTAFGSLAVGPGGAQNVVWQINNATGVSGPIPDANNNVSGWSQLQTLLMANPLTGHQSTGDLDWTATATPGNQFSLSLETLLNPTPLGLDNPGPMANFDPAKPYDWPFITWQGTYTGPTDSTTLTADTLFDLSQFRNTIAGTFALQFDGSNRSIDLVYTPSPVPEPGTLALLGAAAAGFAWRRRRSQG